MTGPEPGWRLTCTREALDAMATAIRNHQPTRIIDNTRPKGT